VYPAAQDVVLGSDTPDAVIHYTTDGTDPATSETRLAYTAPVHIAMGKTIRAIATMADMEPSSKLSAAYTQAGTVEMPTASPAAGAILMTDSITLTSEAGANIRYTIDGVVTAGSGTPYTGAIAGATVIGHTLSAIALKDGMVQSGVLNAAYTQRQAETPVASPGAGAIASTQNITLTSEPDAVIRYTTDNGVVLGASTGTQYTGPIAGSTLTGKTLRAIALKDGMLPSAELSAAYTQSAATVSARDLTSLVTAPVAGIAPNTTAIDTAQYTGTIAWQTSTGSAFTGDDLGAFATSTVYKALVTLTEKPAYTFDGVPATGFTYTNATSVSNTVNSGTVTITFLPTGIGYTIAGSLTTQDLMVKFGIKTSGYGIANITVDNVRDTFKALHYYINDTTRAQAFTSATKSGTSGSVVHLGDYIDLPSLTVTAYGGTGADFGAINMSANAEFTDPLSNPRARLRIIVVGINSFWTSSNGSYSHPSTNNVAHVVFQFQNLPGKQKMNLTETNAGGYAASLMRKYLVPTGDAGSGNFLAGLTAAGVPQGVLWGPKRSMAKEATDVSGADCNVITDLLWLPTEREQLSGMDIAYHPRSETAANQTFLEYYTGGAYSTLIKYNMTAVYDIWWLASPYYYATTTNTIYFCNMKLMGQGVGFLSANSAYGIAPAFCVK
jgi:hypothetical protein